MFDEVYIQKVEEVIRRYPVGRQSSAVLYALDLAQRNNTEGHYVTAEMIKGIAELLKMPEIRVWEVASFFSMVNLKSVGRYHIQLCGTTPCMLRGSEELKSSLENHLGIRTGQTTKDGLFTLTEVECLGACCNAPVVQINDDYFEDLEVESLLRIIDDLKASREVKKGSQIGRKASEGCVSHD